LTDSTPDKQAGSAAAYQFTIWYYSKSGFRCPVEKTQRRKEYGKEDCAGAVFSREVSQHLASEQNAQKQNTIILQFSIFTNGDRML